VPRRTDLVLLDTRAPERRAVAVLLDIALSGAEPPTEFRLFASGLNETTKGPVLCDPEGLSKVMAAFADQGLDRLPVDYGHGMVGFASGIEAHRAAGWFVPASRYGELWATDVQWTRQAREALMAREFRFFSPAVMLDHESGRIEELINVALTNLPATKRQRPLVASDVTALQNDDQGATMNDLQKLLAAHGCQSPEELTRKITELATAAAAGAKAAQRVAELEAQIEKDSRESLITSLSTQGKLAPSLHGWARTLPLAALQAYAKDAPQIASETKVVENSKRETETTAEVDAEALAMLKAFGLTARADDFARVKGALSKATNNDALTPTVEAADVAAALKKETK